ncbi:hypothetical protein GCM10027343_34440 [Noviherbaspirillum agri]
MARARQTELIAAAETTSDPETILREVGMLIPSDEPVPTLEHAILSANCFGLSATTMLGQRAYFAVVDENGQVLDMGDHVAQAAWLLMVEAWRNFLIGGKRPVIAS